MSLTTLERATPRERSWAAAGSAALTVPGWVVDPVRPAPGERPLCEVIPLRPPPEPIVLAGVRLTRRGRLSITVAAAGCMIAVAAVAMSSSATAEGPASAPAASVVVAPGDTLWELAERVDPHGDPRVTVARIIRLNDLSGGHIRPGQKLQLPTG